MDDRVAVAGQEAQGERLLVVVEGRLQIPPPPQTVGDHIRVQRVALVHIHVRLLEIGRQAWMEQEQFHPQVRIVSQGLEQVKPVPAGGFGPQTQFVETLALHHLPDLLKQTLTPRTVVAQGQPGDHFLTIRPHQAVGVGLAVDIHPDDQGLTCHHCTSAKWDVCPRRDRSLAFREINSLVVNESFTPPEGTLEPTVSSRPQLQTSFELEVPTETRRAGFASGQAARRNSAALREPALSMPRTCHLSSVV